MKAIRYLRYGSPNVLRLEEVERPAPGDDEVQVEIVAASVNAYDWHFLTADIFLIRFMGGGLFRPRDPRLGADIAGRVTEVGRNISQFKPGDEVYGMVRGGFAQYACAPQRGLWFKPSNASFEEAAAVPMASITALQGLRDSGRIQAGQRVLVNGASGGVGTFAVQIAKSSDTEVTAVCSAGNLEQARAAGADHVIDYKEEDFTRSGEKYDLIFAANGCHSLGEYRRALTSRGIYVMAGGTMKQIFQSMLLGSLMSEKGGRRMTGVSAKPSQQDLAFMKDLIEAGKVKAMIDRRYPLSKTADALAYLGRGHARGKVVITVDNGGTA